jgi:drug/metabolite transporter (DMT)-like permease
MIELGVLAAFGAMLSWGIGDFLIQRSTRKVGDLETLGFIGLIGAVGLLPFVLVEFPSLLQPQNMALLLLVGIITFVAAVFDFEALKKGKLSVVEVILEIELPITVMLGFFFFQETLSIPQLFLITMIMLGIVFIASNKSRTKLKRGLERGAVLAVIAAVFMGAVNSLTAAGSKQISPLMIIWAPWAMLALVSFVFLAARDGASKPFRTVSKFKKLILLTGIVDTMAWLFFSFAVFDNPLSVTIAITESYPAVAMLLGIWLNKEKIALHQYAGACIALFCSISLGFLV